MHVTTETRNKLDRLIGSGPVRVLIIDDHEGMASALRDILGKFCPRGSKIRLLTRQEYEADVESFVMAFAPHIITLDGSLGKWQHERYKSEGVNMMPFLKRALPEVFVIASSTDREYNKKGMRYGADCCIDKDNAHRDIEHLFS